MNAPQPLKPGDPYTGIVVALWPQLGEDPRQCDLDKAYGQVVTDRTLNLRTGEWEPIPPDGTGPLLRITCMPELHFMDEAPMLAEVWKTNYGLLFISRLPGAAFDPKNDPNDPFAPPTAVLSKDDPIRGARGQSRRAMGTGKEPIPITIVRILLDGPITASLWVKCADHGSAEVDRLKLNRAYELDQVRRRGRDTPEPTVIYLHDVAAILKAVRVVRAPVAPPEVTHWERPSVPYAEVKSRLSLDLRPGLHCWWFRDHEM